MFYNIYDANGAQPSCARVCVCFGCLCRICEWHILQTVLIAKSMCSQCHHAVNAIAFNSFSYKYEKAMCNNESKSPESKRERKKSKREEGPKEERKWRKKKKNVNLPKIVHSDFHRLPRFIRLFVCSLTLYRYNFVKNMHSLFEILITVRLWIWAHVTLWFVSISILFKLEISSFSKQCFFFQRSIFTTITFQLFFF